MQAIQKRWKGPLPAFVCPGCGAHLGVEALVWPIPDLSERVLPGETMPAGVCPDCDELVPRDPPPVQEEGILDNDEEA